MRVELAQPRKRRRMIEAHSEPSLDPEIDHATGASGTVGATEVEDWCRFLTAQVFGPIGDNPGSVHDSPHRMSCERIGRSTLTGFKDRFDSGSDRTKLW